MSWIHNAKIGDKVVCIDNAPLGSVYGWISDESPVMGSIYTIKDIFTAIDGRVVFDLDEIDRDPRVRKIMRDQGYPRIGYGAYRFRPVQPRGTDISVFTDMLKKADQPIKEDA